jgi:hypothetical protein
MVRIEETLDHANRGDTRPCKSSRELTFLFGFTPWQLEEVKVVTGEEDETVVVSLPRAKLFAFEKKEEGSPGECAYS